MINLGAKHSFMMAELNSLVYERREFIRQLCHVGRATMRSVIAGVFVSLVLGAAPVWADTETLTEAWSEAYQNNPSLEAARAKLRATDEQVAQAVSHWRPSVDATSTVGRTSQYIPSQQPFGTDKFAADTYSYNLQVTQPVFRGFRTINQKDSAENQVMAERANLAKAEQQVFLDSAKAFLDVIRDQAVLESERTNEHVLEQKLEETRVRARAGELTQTDVRQAESRLARAHVSRFQAESALTQGRAAYKHLIGHLPEQLKAPSLAYEAPSDVEVLFNKAERQNPSVVAAQYSHESASADVAFNKGSLLPEVNLVGSTGRNYASNYSLPGREDTSQVMLQASMPLYHAGADYSKIRAAQQVVTEKRMELEDERRKAREAAQNAWQAYETADAALKADHDEVEAADLALTGVKEESRIGTRTTLDVLNAEQELLDAKIDLVKSQHDRDYAILQLKASTGELVADNLGLTVDAYNPEKHYGDVSGQWIGFSKDDDHYAVKAKTGEQAEK